MSNIRKMRTLDHMMAMAVVLVDCCRPIIMSVTSLWKHLQVHVSEAAPPLSQFQMRRFHGRSQDFISGVGSRVGLGLKNFWRF